MDATVENPFLISHLPPLLPLSLSRQLLTLWFWQIIYDMAANKLSKA